MSSRFALSMLMLATAIGGVVWIVSAGRLPPADFTFNNDTEIESLDPAVVTGQPEGRIIESLYEGLVRLSAKDRTPKPGVAERWEVSEDGRTYTFFLRKDAKWSDGSPVTSADFVYSMRRFLDPRTLAEYAYQAWYLKNAQRYSRAARGVNVGDPVEVELHTRAQGARPHARGELVKGVLEAIETDLGASAVALAKADSYAELRTFVVRVGDAERRFRVVEEGATVAKGVEPCAQLLLDFNEVGFRAPDDHTVVTELNEPTAFWLQLLGFYPLAPVNQRCIETHGSPRWTDAGKIVTNGPFQLEFRRLRDRIRMRKNPHFWGRDGVKLDVVDALAVESMTTSFNLYETGKVDWITKVSPLIAKELLKVEPPRPDFNPKPQYGTYFYSFNVEREPLDDVRVRRALVMALDRDEIIRTACAGEVPAYSFVPPGTPGYVSPRCPEHDVDGARKLLAEAGYPDGQGFPKIELLYNTEDQHQTIAELIRKQWRRGLRINVATRNEEWATYLSSQRQQRYDAIRRAWIGDYIDPNTFLDLYVTGGENNNTGWGNPEYDRLIAGSKTEVDPVKRLALLRDAERILMAEVPILPIYNYVSRSLVRPHVRGFWSNLQDTHPLQAIWIDRSGTELNEFMAPNGDAPPSASATPAPDVPGADVPASGKAEPAAEPAAG
ncbi:MAG: peptide ABC transporter substrate-binding protein [Lacipirellulaceae bacterium]